MSESKQYEIPKKVVIEAYKRVKANKGSAGIDGIDFERFEKKLNNNLYKIWNRMSSVLSVDIKESWWNKKVRYTNHYGQNCTNGCKNVCRTCGRADVL
mgnify:FL=1